MAYNALNNLIDAYIYANGVQAITGQILNGVLKQMVSQLGSGYHLMGVAGPFDTPAQNDYAMAYFAATAGEYTDFGGITLSAGEVAVLLTSGNGSWSKQTIYNVPTGTADLENTANFITNAVTDLVNYYTKTEVDDTLANYPTLSALATALADYYTKTEIDGQMATRYTKSEVDTKLGDYYRKAETYDKDEVDSIVAALSRQEYIVAWDGIAAPDVSTIPAGVTVTYSGTTYTGTLDASASTVNKIYMVWNGVAYDMYGTSQDGGYSWVSMGTTSVDLSQYATKEEVIHGLLNVGDGVVLTDNKASIGDYSYFKNPLEVGIKYEVTNLGEAIESFVAYDSSKQSLGTITANIPVGNTVQFTFNSVGVSYIGGWTNNVKYSLSIRRIEEEEKTNKRIEDAYFGVLSLYHKKNNVADTESFPVKMRKGETYSVKNNASVLCSFTLYKDGNSIGNFSIPAQGNVLFVCPDDVTEVRGYINALVYSVEITRLHGVNYYTKQDVSPIIKDLTLHDGYIHRNASAGVFPSSVSQYSDPFFVKKGQKVHLEFVDPGVITIIAKYNYFGESNVDLYTTLMASDDPSVTVHSGINVYDYVVTEDMYIAVCGAKESFSFYLDTNINYVLKQETEKSFSTNNNANYSVPFKIQKGHRYLVRNTGNTGTSCFTRWTQGGLAIDAIISEATADSQMTYSLSANSWGIFVASADANYLEGWSSAATTITIEDITDKPAEYFGKMPNIIWQCRDGRVSSVQYPPQTKWAILETAKNQYDRVRLSIRKTTDGYFFLCHDTSINFLATNPDGTDISGGLVSPDGKTLAELNYYDWGHRFGGKWDGMNVPMLEDGLYYANLCNIAVTAELKFVPTQAEMDELWGMFAKYNVDKHLIIDYPDLSIAGYFSTKSKYISFAFGGSIENFRNNLQSYNSIKTEYNQIYYLVYQTFGTPPTDAEISEVKEAGFATWYTPIFNKTTLFDTLGFAKGIDLIECANIPFIKSTVREYADSIIVWP